MYIYIYMGCHPSHWSMLIYQKVTGWWFGTWILFSPILGMMIQSDFHIFQDGSCTTLTRTQGLGPGSPSGGHPPRTLLATFGRDGGSNGASDGAGDVARWMAMEKWVIDRSDLTHRIKWCCYSVQLGARPFTRTSLTGKSSLNGGFNWEHQVLMWFNVCFYDSMCFHVFPMLKSWTSRRDKVAQSNMVTQSTHRSQKPKPPQYP